jgi:phage protein D
MRQQALAPFIEVLVVKSDAEIIDISDQITNFSYKESIEKDNLVEFTIITAYNATIEVDENIEIGAELRFMFGYRGGDRSSVHTCRITDVDYDYIGMNITLKVRALDKGAVMKKVTSTQVYSGKTSSQIATEIAERYGMTAVVDETTEVWDNQPQGGMDDLNFLRKLASQETAGNYMVFIKDNELHFVRRGLDKASDWTFRYGDGNNGVIKFKPSYRESTAEAGAGANVQAFGFDNEGGKFTTAEETAEGENKDIATDDYKVVWSGNGDFLGGQNSKGTSMFSSVESLLGDKVENGLNIAGDTKDTSGIGKILNTGKQMLSAGNTSDKAAGVKKAGTIKILEVDMELIGNPLLYVNTMITMERVLKRHAGNWFVTEVSHDITASGYRCKVKMGRNATKVPTAKNTKVAGVVNGTVGKPEGSDEVELLIFNVDGDRITDKTKSGNYIPPQPVL